MADKILKTILILRHDGEQVWANSSVKLQKGELALCYNDNGTVTAKVGVGENGSTWAESLLLDKALQDALAAEVTRAKDAEKALGEKIDGIDFVDAGELADAIKDFATKTELEDAIKDFATTTELETAVEGLEKAISEIVHFTTEVVSSVDDVTKTSVLYLIKDESVAGVDKYNEYILIDGAPVLIGDTTTDLSNYYNKTEVDDKVKAVSDALGEEVSAREAIADKVAALEAVDNATQAELDAYKEEVADALDLKLDASDFETFKTSNDAALAKKIESATIAHTSEGVAEGVTVDGTALKIVVDAYTKQEVRDYVADVIEDMTGGESAADVLLALNNHIATYEEKVGQIDTKDAAQDESIKDLGDGLTALTSNVYTKGEVDNLVAPFVTNDALTTTLNGYYTKDDADAEFLNQTEVDERINALIVASDPEGGKTIENIQNLVKYVDENADDIAVLVTDVNKNKEDIAANAKAIAENTTAIAKNADDISAMTETVGGNTAAIEANAAAIALNGQAIAKNAEDIVAVSDALAAIVQPKASKEVTVAEDGTLGLGEVSTDKLVMGENTLIIYGGDASK